VLVAARHRNEMSALKAGYNEAIDKLKAEMLQLIDERASAVEAVKRDYEAELLSLKQASHSEREALRDELAKREHADAKRQERPPTAHHHPNCARLPDAPSPYRVSAPRAHRPFF